MLKFHMTIPQFMEYERLKEKSPKFTEFDLYTAIIGSALCLGKELSKQLGYYKLAMTFLMLSKDFFWILIIISLIKGIEKTCYQNTRKAGIGQLIGSGISIALMLS